MPSRGPIDPLLTLQLPPNHNTATNGSSGQTASVSSVCFLPSSQHEASSVHSLAPDNGDDDGSSDSSDEEITFRCSGIVDRSEGIPDSAMAASALSGRLLASCDAAGASIWDLGTQKVIQKFSDRAPGLLLRRTDEKDPNSNIVYHCRDAEGTVSLHDVVASEDRVRAIQRIETSSRTFCCAAPCTGNPNLIALPSDDDKVAVVRDWRVAPTCKPVATVRTEGDRVPSLSSSGTRKYGMVASLALSETESDTGRRVLACGMESGSLLLYDLAMDRAPIGTDEPFCLELGRDPVLSLDMSRSKLPSSSSTGGSVVAVGGMAGSRDDLMSLPQKHRGTVGVIKATISDVHGIKAHVRTRIATCNNEATSSPIAPAGKPGVALCRFRPDGRLFAVGGWDKRLRVFDRSALGKPLAILRGHTDSVNAVDWAPDSASSGLLATGAADGRIHVWRCFRSHW